MQGLEELPRTIESLHSLQISDHPNPNSHGFIDDTASDSPPQVVEKPVDEIERNHVGKIEKKVRFNPTPEVHYFTPEPTQGSFLSVQHVESGEGHVKRRKARRGDVDEDDYDLGLFGKTDGTEVKKKSRRRKDKTAATTSGNEQVSEAKVDDDDSDKPKMLQLTIEKGPLAGQSKVFRTDCKVQIGRDNKSNKMCIKEPSIASQHLKAEYSLGKWNVIDLGASSGTFLNGRQLDPQVATALSEGDVLRIGKTTLVRVMFDVEDVEESGEGQGNRRSGRRGVVVEDDGSDEEKVKGKGKGKKKTGRSVPEVENAEDEGRKKGKGKKNGSTAKGKGKAESEQLDGEELKKGRGKKGGGRDKHNAHRDHETAVEDDSEGEVVVLDQEVDDENTVASAEC